MTQTHRVVVVVVVELVRLDGGRKFGTSTPCWGSMPRFFGDTIVPGSFGSLAVATEVGGGGFL